MEFKIGDLYSLDDPMGKRFFKLMLINNNKLDFMEIDIKGFTLYPITTYNLSIGYVKNFFKPVKTKNYLKVRRLP